MHRAIVNSQASRWNTRFYRLLIIAALTLSAVQKAQSMPSRELKQLPASLELDLVEKKYDEQEESTLYAEETPPIITNVPVNRTKRHQTTQTNRRDSTTVKTRSSSDAISFPDRQEFIPKPVPLQCENKTFCEDTAAYPQELVSNLINEMDSLKFFGITQFEIGQRIDASDGSNGETLCGSAIEIVYPKTAQKENKEWLFIVQDEKKGFKQGVKIENCNQGTEEGACKIIEGSVFGYKTSCKQKYVARVMAALHINGTAVTENFRMPSSCCCQIKLDVDGITSRSGAGGLKGQSPAPKNPKSNH